MDIHVRTPGGTEIWYSNTFDSISGGRLDQDDIPNQIGLYIENIYFPSDGSAPEGTYEVWVENYDQYQGADSWELSVFLGNSLVMKKSGVISEDERSQSIYYVQTSSDGDDDDDDTPGVIREVLTWRDIVKSDVEIDGVRVLYVDTEKILSSEIFDGDPYWWKFYRTFWRHNEITGPLGVGDFVGQGELYEAGIVGFHCFGLEAYRRAIEEISFNGQVFHNVRGCIRRSSMYSNQPCNIYMPAHYRAPIGDLFPGTSSLGPNYYTPGGNSGNFITVNFSIYLKETVVTSMETFGCYGSSFERVVHAGEVTIDGWGIVPAGPSIQGEWLFVVPAGSEVSVNTSSNGPEIRTN